MIDSKTLPGYCLLGSQSTTHKKGKPKMLKKDWFQITKEKLSNQ